MKLWIGTLVLVALVLAIGLVVWVLRRRRKGPEPLAAPLPKEPSWLGRRNKPCLVVTGLAGSKVETLLDPLTGGRTPSAGWLVLGETLIHVVPEDVLQGAEDRAWESVLRRLARRRPARPVDGLVLAVPVPLPEPSEPAVLQLRERLDRLRERLGFVVPVYVVLTGGERLAGFREFVRALAPEQRDEMLGWSSGHRLDAVLPEDWVEEASSSIESTLARMQLTLLGGAHRSADAEQLLALPDAVSALRKPMARWLQPLFRAVAGEDAHWARGIYLCGEGAFLQDLWERKVLPEMRLARPAAGQTVTRGWSGRVAQVATAALALVLTAGTGWAYHRLAWMRDTHVEPLLDALAHVKDSGASRLTQAFDFLETVEALEVQRFGSVFLPGSWNDPVDERIERILKPAFQRLVVNACQRGLEEKLRLEPLGRTEEAEDEVVPDLSARFEQDPNYEALALHVQQATRVEEHLSLYQKLRDRQAAGFGEVDRLLRFLRGDAVVPATKRAARRMEQRLMAEAEWPAVAGRERFLAESGRRTQELADAFFASWIGGGLLPAAIEQVTARIESFEQGVDGGDAAFAELDEWIETTAAAFDSGAWDWAVGEFDRRRWGVLGQPLDQSPFASAALLESVDAAGREQQRALAAQLRAAGRTVGGPVVELNGKIRLDPSVRTLGAAVTRLRSFAAQTSESATLATLTGGAGYVWNSAELRQAPAMEASYQQFLRDAVSTLPPRFQAAMRQIAAARARSAALARVARARVPNRTPHQDGAGAESALALEIRGLSEAVETFPAVAQMLDALNAAGERENLRRLLITQASELLTTAEREFDRLPLYRPLASQGRETAGAMTVALYDARSKQEVRRFLDGERERIESFARNFAVPLVNALDKLGVGDRTRAARWRALQTGLQDYAAAKPGNTLRSLETFIEEGLDRIQPEAQCQAGTPTAGADLFTAAERMIRDQASALCVQQLLGQYQQLAALFNLKLAGRYPFTADPHPDEKPGVEPRDAEQFFQAVDRYGAAITGVLQSDARYGEAGRRVTEFLARAAALRPLFALAEGETGPVLGVTADFRADQAREVGGNQVMDWSMRVGDQTITAAQSAPATRWKHGDRTRMEFRYAKDAPVWPATSPAGAMPLVDGRTVSFDLRHPWSLLQMLREFAVPAAEATRGNPAAHLLRFRIPNQGPGPATPPASVLFVRVNLEAVAGRRGLPLVVPVVFPDQAPLLERPLVLRSSRR